MTTLRLSSIEAFTAPLDYHQNAALFLAQAATDLPARAATVIGQVRAKFPQYATQLETAINAFASRLTGESAIHSAAVTYLQSHRAWLAENEATLAGTPIPTFPELSSIVPAWLVVRPMPISNCFDLLRSVLNTYDHVLYGADQTLRDFENLIWKLVNDPASLNVHVGWSGNPFADAAGWVVNEGAQVTGVDAAIQAVADLVRANEGTIRNAIDTVRRGIEYVFLPLVDGQVLQDLVDHLQGLHDAYQQHIQQPFVPTTQAFVAAYTPPQGHTSYQDALGSFHQIQTTTGNNAGTFLGQMNSLQNLNEQVSLGQMGMATDGGECLICFGALVAFPPDFELTLPTITWRGIDLGAILARVVGFFITIGEAFATIAGIVADAVVAALPIIALTAVAVTVISLAGDSALPATGTWVIPGTDGEMLPKDLRNSAKKIWYKYQDKLVGILTQGMIALLLCYYSAAELDILLAFILDLHLGTKVFASEVGAHGRGIGWEDILPRALNRDNWALNMIHALLLVGPENVVDMSRLWSEDVNGVPQSGDVDLVVNSPFPQPTRYIEVGGPSKGDDIAASIADWTKEKAYARQHNAVAQLYIQEPSNPAAMASFNRAVEAAQQIFGAQNVVIMPPGSNVCST